MYIYDDIILCITQFTNIKTTAMVLTSNNRLFNKYIGTHLLSKVKINPDFGVPDKFKPYVTCLYDVKSLEDITGYKNLTNIIFNNYFNDNVDNLQQSLTSITFGYGTCSDDYSFFNRPIDNLPRSLLNLDLTWAECFNQKIDILPQSLRVLYLGDYFNQPLDKLPQSLRELYLGKYFKQSVDKLPQFLKTLYLGEYFDQKIDNLPQSLIKLEFGNDFNQSINLPPFLVYLRLGWRFNKRIMKLPRSLKRIEIENGYDYINELKFLCYKNNTELSIFID